MVIVDCCADVHHFVQRGEKKARCNLICSPISLLEHRGACLSSKVDWSSIKSVKQPQGRLYKGISCSKGEKIFLGMLYCMKVGHCLDRCGHVTVKQYSFFFLNH